MSVGVNGELVPVGGGEAVPLIRATLTVGRRDSCDICMRFPNISGVHCELNFRDGFWYITDLNSTNGIKVNGTRVGEMLLRPNDEVTIGKRLYRISYTLPTDHRAPDEEADDILTGESLLEKAGLERQKPKTSRRPKADPTHPDEVLRRLLGFSNDDDKDDK